MMNQKLARKIFAVIAFIIIISMVVLYIPAGLF